MVTSTKSASETNTIERKPCHAKTSFDRSYSSGRKDSIRLNAHNMDIDRFKDAFEKTCIYRIGLSDHPTG